MVRPFGWHWASLTQHDHDDLEAIAVVNEDRSLAIFPFHYTFGFLGNRVAPTVLLAFNMLKGDKIPKQTPGARITGGERHDGGLVPQHGAGFSPLPRITGGEILPL